ncbi:tyrosine-type recombinase/integrase [Methylorubrum podarium]|uniref:Tyrosine-type recombinase/integrase n=1 Tax=Methylorubrum podarium TaxID=200476 RepID=A0ABV1QJM2_9HYPH
MTCVRKRNLIDKAGKPYIRYVVDYKDSAGVRRTPQFEKKKEADAYLDKVKRELFEGVHLAASQAMTFTDLADLFLKDCERRHRIRDAMSGNTLRLARLMVRGHLLPAFGKDKVTDITGAKVRSFVNSKAERYARVTVGKMIKQLRDILQFGIREGHLRRNVVREDPPRNPVPARGQIEIPSIEQLRSIVAVIEKSPKDASDRLVKTGWRAKEAGAQQIPVVVYLALTAGLRCGEICGLRWENVDLIRGIIHVKHSLSRVDGLKGPKSKAGLRTAPIVAALHRHLHVLWDAQGRPPVGPVICTEQGGPVAAQALGKQLWLPVAKAAGVTRDNGTLMGLHAVRHAAVSLWIKAGLGDLALKGVVGHASVSTTKDVYGHLYAAEGDAGRAMNSSLALLRLTHELDAPR